MANSLTAEIAAAAARFIVEDGMEYGQAKRRAAKLVGRRTTAPAELPSNELIEDEVRAYISIFCADSQAHDLAVLRRVALKWMERLVEFQPHLAGAAWNGTATRRNDIWINLFCDDPKAAEISMINWHMNYDVGNTTGFRGEPVDVLTLAERVDAFERPVLVHLSIYDRDDLRGALKSDSRGRKERGGIDALRSLVGGEA